MLNILEDFNIAFHGISFDYFKMLSILQTGILSYDAALDGGIVINRNYGGYNGDSQVSLSESPSIHGTYNYGAFNVFVKKGISFVIDIGNLYCIPDTKSGIPGEIYVNYIVPRENIIGIMLPKDLLYTSIDKLNIFSDMGTAYIDSFAISFIDKINVLFETDFGKEEIFNLIEMKNNLNGYFFDKMNKEKIINKEINETITKLFDLAFRIKYNLSDSPTLLDVITILIGDSIPIYSTDGKLLSKSDIKKLKI